MAKTIERIRLFVRGSDEAFTNIGMYVDYRVTDGDLSKNGQIDLHDIYEEFVLSGIDQTVSGFWDTVIDEIKEVEGI